MSAKLTDDIADLEKKIKALQAQKIDKENKLKAQEKKRQSAIMWAYGEVVMKMLESGKLSPEDWQKNCTEFLPEGKKRELAVLAIAELAVAKKEGTEKEK
jgi:hypothetical protein